MLAFSATCEAIAATTRKTEKVRLVADYFRSRPVSEAAQAAVFLSGRAFPAREERTLQVGGSLLWRALAAVSGKPDVALTAAYRRHGDLGAAAEDLLAGQEQAVGKLSLADVTAAFDEMSRTGRAEQKLRLVEDLLRRATPLQAKYIVKIVTGDLRIGLKESLVEEAIAAAFEEQKREVQRANMLLGDIGETLRLAARHSLREARMRLFHPIGFMLASPAQDAGEAFSYFSPMQVQVEDKYDGIRAQVHCGGAADQQVRIFSRTLDEISRSFPELVPALRAFPQPVVLDGEILAWSESRGQALPFAELQRRLGRKRVAERLAQEVPVVYMVFDVLYAAGELKLEEPLEQRRATLEQLFASVPAGAFNVARGAEIEGPQGRLAFEPALTAAVGPPRVMLAPALQAGSAEQLQDLFAEARRRGNEGLMVKDPKSAYTPGRRGKSWLKLKRELATLDVVVTAVEWGHGKRAGVLSDYTFAVRDGDRLLNVGKAYSGLTDAEIAEMTQWFLEHTQADQGFRRIVEPKVVLEVAFNNVMKSDRHESGFALRFPRILRIRGDKPPEEIDTLETVQKIYERQKTPQERAL